MLQRAMACLKIDADILALVAGDAWMMGALDAVAALGPPDARVGARVLRGAPLLDGFVRFRRDAEAANESLPAGNSRSQAGS